MSTHHCQAGTVGDEGIFRCCEDTAEPFHVNWDASSDWSGTHMSPAQAFNTIASHLTDHDTSADTYALLDEAVSRFHEDDNVLVGVAALHAGLPNMTMSRPA